MRQKYLYVIAIIAIIAIFFIIYYTNTNTSIKTETFTPRIRAFYRPYVRNMNQYYDYALNEYGLQFIMNKLRKWNIY